MKTLFVYAGYSTRDATGLDTSIYPNLGLLTLMASLKAALPEENAPEYLDGMVYGNIFIKDYIKQNAEAIVILCLSAVSWNYQASIEIASYAKELNPRIIIIMGNDHFSALHETIMANQRSITYGFYGNDIVEGFTAVAAAIILGKTPALETCPGLVYRDANGKICRNQENPDEYSRLPLVDYAAADSPFPHNEHYLKAQQNIYAYMRERNLKSTLVDIGRGCIKFTGNRHDDIFENACDFCGIVPGSKAIMEQSADRAWALLENAYLQGYNYFYITADELPLTLWGLLKTMIQQQPDWHRKLPQQQRPKMFAYARAEGFSASPEKIDLIIDRLGFNHFMIGFDGLSKISLEVINKRPVTGSSVNPFRQNVQALQKVVKKGCLITAGFVVTHLGITPVIMEDNFRNLSEAISLYPATFAELDFAPLCPIPGSQSFRYLTEAGYAKERAKKFGLTVNNSYLLQMHNKYRGRDLLDMEELSNDFIIGCCPDISIEYVTEYLQRIKELADKHGIAIGGGV